MIVLKNSNTPIYKQIAEQVKNDIVNNKISEGDRLPAIRALARDLRIPITTVIRAYNLLAEDGVLSVQESGYIVHNTNNEI